MHRLPKLLEPILDESILDPIPTEDYPQNNPQYDEFQIYWDCEDPDMDDRDDFQDFNYALFKKNIQ